MRKLTYTIFNKYNVWVDTVESYEKAKEYKKNGYQVEEKLVEIPEERAIPDPIAYKIVNGKLVRQSA